jgi:polysaccharide biosynthesis transport protein
VPAPTEYPGRKPRYQPSNFDFGALWFAFRRRWLPILLIGTSLAVVLGYTAWICLPRPKASAQVVYEVSSETPSIVYRLPDSREFNSFKQYQSNLVTKRSVLTAVLNEPGITSIKEYARANDPLQWLEDRLKVDFKLGQGYLRVTAELEKAEDALALIKAVDKNYIYESVMKEKERKEKQLADVRAIQSAKQKALEEELARLRQLAEKGGAATNRVAALQAEFIQESLNHANKERLRIGDEIRRLRVALAGRNVEAGKLATMQPPEHLVQAELESNNQIKAEKAMLVDLERRLKEYKETLIPGRTTHRLVELSKSVSFQRSILEELPKKLRAQAVEAAQSKHFIAVNASKESLESELAMAESIEKKLEDDVKRLEKDVKQLKTTQHDFEKSRIQIAQLEKETEHLFETASKMGIELQAPARVALFQEPTVTIPDDSRRRLKFAGIAAIAGFLLGAGPLWLRELRRRIFHEESQLSNEVPIPVLGTIPSIPLDRPSHSVDAAAKARMNAIVTESIDSTRATVLFKLQETGGRSIMITSSVACEAKSSVSAHIAISLARSGLRTLVIDADVSRPSLHRLFGVQMSAGLSDVLLARSSLDDAVQTSQIPNLFVLSGGDWAPSASACLGGNAWKDLLREAKERFDVVVIDSPAILLTADALTMARDVDIVLLSALKDVSEIDLIKKTLAKLESLGITPKGIIASGVNHRIYKPEYYDRLAFSNGCRVKA